MGLPSAKPLDCTPAKGSAANPTCRGLAIIFFGAAGPILQQHPPSDGNAMPSYDGQKRGSAWPDGHQRSLLKLREGLVRRARDRGDQRVKAPMAFAAFWFGVMPAKDAERWAHSTWSVFGLSASCAVAQLNGLRILCRQRGFWKRHHSHQAEWP